MSYLYILSESDNDDVFYHRCVERLTGRTFERVPYRLRKGGGIAEVRSKSRLLFQQIVHTGFVDETFFVVALDNDRSPVHPDHAVLSKLSERDQRKECRFCAILATAETILGPRERWPIGGAIAVPVQMLESWLLLICDPARYERESDLPLFAEMTQPEAVRYYRPKQPPKQLKDLRDREKDARGIVTNPEFCAYCADRLDAMRLSDQSPSFALFKAQVDAWTAASA